MIDLDRYPHVAAARARQRDEEAKYSRWLEWATKVDAENQRRREAHTEALARAQATGELPPDPPQFLERTAPPYNEIFMRSEFARWRRDAIAVDADDIVRDANNELGRLDEQAAPIRHHLAKLDEAASDVRQVVHLVTTTAARAKGHN